jgi:hypothetical protein
LPDQKSKKGQAKLALFWSKGKENPTTGRVLRWFYLEAVYDLRQTPIVPVW